MGIVEVLVAMAEAVEEKCTTITMTVVLGIVTALAMVGTILVLRLGAP